MNELKVTIVNKDKVLGAILRAIAVETAGFPVVRGMNQKYLKEKGYYIFRFSSQSQVDSFRSIVDDYIRDRHKGIIAFSIPN